MADILPFKRATKRNTTLCANGHHKWQIVTEKRFDVKQGKLVTLYQCKHCEAQKTKAH